MSPGKLAAQAGHAFVDSLFCAIERDPTLRENYFRANSSGTKVTLVASSEFRLLRAHQDAQKAGLPCALIIDQHHVHPPHFDGSPIITALGIGPARRADVRAITKRFSTL